MAELGLAGISDERLKDLSEIMIANDAVLCPTFRAFKAFEEEIKAAEAKGELTEEQKARQRMLSGMNAVSDYFVKKLSEYGVKMLVGQDSIEPVGTLEEMVLMNEAGVTELEVLRGATIYAAEWLEVDDRYGTVEPGKIADLIVLNSNPLDDIAHVGDVFMVIQHGEIVKK
jgi:imidazolonepropionase-like amidohydrolase